MQETTVYRLTASIQGNPVKSEIFYDTREKAKNALSMLPGGNIDEVVVISEYTPKCTNITGGDGASYDDLTYGKRDAKIILPVSACRKRTGLSVAGFAKKLQIPVRTVQDWEAGKRTPPSYVISMIKHMIATENITTSSWAFITCRGTKRNRKYKLFGSRQQAVLYAESRWSALKDSEKFGYMNDQVSEFLVAEIPVKWDQNEEKYVPVQGSEFYPVWNAPLPQEGLPY